MSKQSMSQSVSDILRDAVSTWVNEDPRADGWHSIEDIMDEASMSRGGAHQLIKRQERLGRWETALFRSPGKAGGPTTYWRPKQ